MSETAEHTNVGKSVTAEALAESPIEEAALRCVPGPSARAARVALSGRGVVPDVYQAFFVGEFGEQFGLAALVVPQLRLRLGRARCRLDIGVIAELGGRRVSLALECDGFEFHSTAEDVQSDKRRDRLLQSYGWLVFRYPGREIMEFPEKAAKTFWAEVFRALSSWSQAGDLVTIEVQP